jgi:predicted transcriptional regulator
MSKLKRHTKTPIVLKNESLKDFFARGRKVAKILDEERRPSKTKVIAKVAKSVLPRRLRKADSAVTVNLASFKLAGYSLPMRTISFEDTEDLVKFLTENKLSLLSTVRKKPFSISDLAKALHRSRSAVDKDIQLLESVGILKSEYVINPGHGRCRMVTAFDKNPIKLTVEATI